MATVKAVIHFDPSCRYFLHITKMWDRRKNTAALMQVMSRLENRIPNARLIVKDIQMKQESTYHENNVIYVGHHLSDRELNALYRLSSCCISPHHAEGWGFTISDAVLFKKPIIATGYSGNLEYLNESSALLLSYEEKHIAAEDQYELFDGTMSWAYPNLAELADKIVWVYENFESPSVCQITENALKSVARFNPNYIWDIVSSRLNSIGC